MPLILLLAAALQAGPADPASDRYVRCLALATGDPKAAHAESARWRAAGGGFLALQCGARAFVVERQWSQAAAAFTEAARAAEVAHDDRAATYWAQAGNAWLAAGDAIKARGSLDAALIAGTLKGLDLGEARLDHARALVATGDLESARTDIDLALAGADADPLAWLLSATLARRAEDLPRAKKDIAEALRRSPDDASVQLEAGNIAALLGSEDRAREHWVNAARIAPDTPVGKSAAAALTQFGNAKEQ